MSTYEALFVTFNIVLAFIIGRDASRRGMGIRSWVILTLLFGLLTIPLYLLLKKPLPDNSGRRQ